MDEVARGLPCVLAVFTIVFSAGDGIVVLEMLVGDSTFVQGGQKGLVLTRRGTRAVYVLGIDIATADTGLHVDEVELDDTGDVAPVLLVDFRAGTLLSGQLQIDTGSQGHFVVAVSVVAFLLVVELLLPVEEGGCAIRFTIGIGLIGSNV